MVYHSCECCIVSSENTRKRDSDFVCIYYLYVHVGAYKYQYTVHAYRSRIVIQYVCLIVLLVLKSVMFLYFIADFFDRKTVMVHTSFVVAHTLGRTKYSQFGTLTDAVTISSSKAP